MEKKHARDLLEMNQTELAKLLCISKSHLSRIPKLTDAMSKIVRGALAERILKDAVKTIEKLENQVTELENQLAAIAVAASKQA